MQQLKERAAKSRTASANWNDCEVLIVDEISMLHGSLLTKLDIIAKYVTDFREGDVSTPSHHSLLSFCHHAHTQALQA